MPTTIQISKELKTALDNQKRPHTSPGLLTDHTTNFASGITS